MQVKTYNQEGKETGTADLPDRIFGVALNKDLVHQVATAQMARRRQVSAHTKGRGEVSGGGRKPWAQKHTGRARHGSTRSPIWIGGGVAFGPTKARVFAKKVNRKMRRKALCMVLSEKARGDLLVLVEDIAGHGMKTTVLASMLRNLPCDRKTSVLALPDMNREIIRAGENIPGVQTMQAKDLNALDLLHSKYVVMPKRSIEVIEKTFAK